MTEQSILVVSFSVLLGIFYFFIRHYFSKIRKSVNPEDLSIGISNLSSSRSKFQPSAYGNFTRSLLEDHLGFNEVTDYQEIDIALQNVKNLREKTYPQSQ